MFQYSIFSKHRSQVSMYLISIMVTLIVLTFVVINIGKTAKDKTYADNAADAGALAAATAMATAFNYVADKNDNDEPTDNEEEARNADRENADLWEAANQNDLEQQGHAIDAQAPLSGPSIPFSADQGREQENNRQNAQEQQQDNQAHREAQRRDMSQQADKAHGEQGEQNNYYDNALKAGYLYNFYNAGIFHRLGRINQRRFSQFLQQIQETPPQNGEPKTFFWVDGAARIHTVTAIIEIEPMDNWDVEESQDQSPTTDEKLNQSATEQESALEMQGQSMWQFETGNIFPGTLWDMAWDWGGNGSAMGSRNTSTGGTQTLNDAEQGMYNSKSRITKNKTLELQNSNPKWINDIIHSQTVYSSNFQFHMGGVVKGMRGDVDLLGPTVYPPVQSSAVATFNCTQQGQIHRRGGSGSDSKFEACLIAAF